MNTKKALYIFITAMILSIMMAPCAYAKNRLTGRKAINAADVIVKTEDESASDTVASPSDAAPSCVSLGSFITTAYCPCDSCSGGWGRSTCTGAVATANHTIAVDPNVIPYGTKVLIDGVVYTAEDRGGAVKGNHIDIFFDSHEQTHLYGKRNVEVFLINS